MALQTNTGTHFYSQPQNNTVEVYKNDHLTEEEARAFIRSISPPRDLICPITLTIFHDAVLALGDGQTYERHAIETWLRTQGRNTTRNSGDATADGVTGVRSPVTNAYMEDRHALTIIPNKVACDMAGQFREKLGKELVGYVHAIDDRNHGDSGQKELGDGGFRIRNLVEMGADLSMVDQGHSAFEWLIKKRRLELVQFLLSHYRSVGDDPGASSSGILSVVASVDLIKEEIQDMDMQRSRNDNTRAWKELLLEVERRAEVEIEAKRRREAARNAHNDRQRERQRALATDHARNIAAMGGGDNGTIINGTVIRNGLGDLDNDGIGYFPSLSALQFQGSVPPPPRSFAEAEEGERKRLDFIVKCTSSLILLMWLLG